MHELMSIRNQLAAKDEISTSHNAKNKIWNRAFLTLPRGLYSIVITGQRGNFGHAGIHLDDITIKACSDFSKLDF